MPTCIGMSGSLRTTSGNSGVEAVPSFPTSLIWPGICIGHAREARAQHPHWGVIWILSSAEVSLLQGWGANSPWHLLLQGRGLPSPLTVPFPAESWRSCLSTCSGPAMGACGPWRCGGLQSPMEHPPVIRPLPPATGRAAPPSALGKGRGPVGPPPPLASPPLHSLSCPLSDLSALGLGTARRLSSPGLTRTD